MQRYSPTLLLTSELDGGVWLTLRPGGVGLSWTGAENLRPSGIRSPDIHPVASRYINFAALDHWNMLVNYIKHGVYDCAYALLFILVDKIPDPTRLTPNYSRPQALRWLFRNVACRQLTAYGSNEENSTSIETKANSQATLSIRILNSALATPWLCWVQIPEERFVI
jgi:hypothetical protein